MIPDPCNAPPPIGFALVEALKMDTVGWEVDGTYFRYIR